MKNIFKSVVIIELLFLLNNSVGAQIDNGTNYISNSKSNRLAAKSQCDIIYTKKDKIVNALVKDTLVDVVLYKLCNDYGTNATVMGGVMSMNINEIEKIIFKDGSIKSYGKSNIVSSNLSGGLNLLNINKNKRKLYIKDEVKKTKSSVYTNYLIVGLDYTSFESYNQYWVYDPSYWNGGYWTYDYYNYNNPQLYVKYAKIKKFGYYASIYTDFGGGYGIFGSTAGFCYKLNKFMNLYSGAGFEFADEEGQIEAGLILDFKRIPLDIGYRLNFDWSELSGFRIGTGFKF